MAKSERAVNPAAAQRKADKQKEIAKSRKQQQGQRNEKLAKRNPERLQKQIDELKELETAGRLRPKDKETLTQLERDLKGVRKARDVLGVKDEGRKDVRAGQRQRRQGEQRVRGNANETVLGKKRRWGEDEDNRSGSDTDPEVRNIPMPRDTPPPIPQQLNHGAPRLGSDGQRLPHALPVKPVLAAPQLTYGAAPQIRDLKKEATRFMPSVVAQAKGRMKGQGKLLEPEELEKLEAGGYGGARSQKVEGGNKVQSGGEVKMTEIDLMELEARRFQREMAALEAESGRGEQGVSHEVEMEEVEDDGT
ncbi:hypothetical protein LTR62_001824 [Meristemomyces frigidus]|uniref:Wbp11/ELF5/Saf1 N-terminal domain-containing protein n=1 Tax=Meristemomyces frigidus TaxID=1508187 RepID=A0AAN7TSB1_9PEZI|nr:hypothetical protein LTR62_001824 [Meristemomyces frigidus]